MPVPVSITSHSTYSPGGIRLGSIGSRFLGADIGGAHRQRAAIRHGIARIDGEIDDHLLELVDVDLDQAEIAAMHDLELDLLAEQPAEQIAEIGDDIGERQDFRAQRLAARESQKLAHQIGGAIGVLLDVHDVGEGRIGRPVLGEQQIGEADDGGQHIVEVMRDAAGQLADRLHLLALRQLHFERLVLGLVEGKDDEAASSLGRRRVK